MRNSLKSNESGSHQNLKHPRNQSKKSLCSHKINSLPHPSVPLKNNIKKTEKMLLLC